VLNVITGYGLEAGQPLTNHSNIAKIAFTGSFATGSSIMSIASKSVKNVTLELGGKSAFIIFDDIADHLDVVIDWILVGFCFNQGQVCSATSRLLVHENIANQIKTKLLSDIQSIKIGSGLNESNTMGPLISNVQYQKVLKYIQKGVEEGGKLLCGGVEKNKMPSKGYFVPPTVFDDVNVNMTIWNEEIFGPVLCIKTFKTEQEAIRLANNSEYGLAAAVMSKDKERCERVAKELEAGIVWINCSQPTFVEAPWGGIKKSGIGRELGPWGLDNYLQVKQITSYQLLNVPFGWYIPNKANL